MAAAASQKTSLKKRLIVCCDGTWNNSVSTNNPLTNVSRLSRCTDDVGADGTPQIVYYHTGIGSGTSSFTDTVDAATGRGIHHIIKNVYTFICLNFNNPEDKIFLIGFSRGAYTVRCLTSLIGRVGLLKKAGLGQINYLYKSWVRLGSMADPDKVAFDKTLQKLQDLDQLRTNIEIEVCAVWETVSALGIPVSVKDAPLDLFSLDFRKTSTVDSEVVPPRLKNAFHAVALNELRKDYKPILWARPLEPTNVRQCWFLGSHSDVGGGYEECWLANITLIWMVAQLRKYTRLAISDEYLKQYLQPTGLSHPRDDAFIIHGDADTNSADPSVALPSKNSVLVALKALVNTSYKGIFALGPMTFRAPGGIILKRKASNRGAGDESELVSDYRQGATADIAKQTIHSSVRVLTCSKLAKSYNIDSSKTEILTQEDDPLGTEHRVIWRVSNPAGRLGRVEAWFRRLDLQVDIEGEVFEDLMCEEEVLLVELWIDVLMQFVKDGPNDSTGDSDSALVGTSTENIVGTSGDKVERLVKTTKKKGLLSGWKHDKQPSGVSFRELLRTLIHEAQEPTAAWMYPRTEEA